MSTRTKNCDVKGGRIRVLCARCKTVRYVAVSSSARKKMVRCKCGKATMYVLNHRGFVRESISGQAQLELSNGQEFRIYLNDISAGGIGFTVKSGRSRSMRIGQDTTLKYRGPTGSSIQRKAKIKNIAGMRIGAEFIDHIALLAKRAV